MKEQFIPYKQALELKKLGFDEECLGYFSTEKGFEEQFKLAITPCQLELLAQAPLWQQAFDWIGEKYELEITIRKWIEEEGYSFNIYNTSTEEILYQVEGKDKYEARLNGLNKLLQVIKD